MEIETIANTVYNTMHPVGSQPADIIWEQISLIDHATEFNALVLAKGDSYRLSLSQLSLVLEKTNELLAKLRGK